MVGVFLRNQGLVASDPEGPDTLNPSTPRPIRRAYQPRSDPKSPFAEPVGELLATEFLTDVKPSWGRSVVCGRTGNGALGDSSLRRSVPVWVVVVRRARTSLGMR